jgi:polyhydroxyalkanoate synthesis regulator phasin
MATTHKNGAKRAMKVPEFLKDQFEQAQVTLGRLEGSAEKTLKELVEKGKAGRKDLTALLEKLASDERFTELRGRIEKLQKTGTIRAEEWRDKAENFRTEALERIVELQGKAVKFLGVATRDEIEELHRELDRLARKFEKGRSTRPARKVMKKGEV